MRPICVPCRRFMRPAKNGVYFVEGMPLDDDKREWTPYKLWMGDLWKCPECGTETIAGTGREPVSERHRANFERDVRVTKGADITINDC